ncbi:glycosyl hydrolase family 63 protein [Nitzschia inconspicua]|uniref:Mannosyl-oligosaccharide glucosidase n=1 Tax=Nitzschia inconspicua TaxID=303405 RepID=A0A9K3LN85_9STRA|nr:glycosyl hydrolase family 63 protein [Nitzschia inconspicua]
MPSTIVILVVILALLTLFETIDHVVAVNMTVSKLCGTYRSYPYVGIQCQNPNSPVMGLLWYQPSIVGNTTSLKTLLRHEANHDDTLQQFGWNQHDGTGYGTQDIIDQQNHIKLRATWVHLNQQKCGDTKNTRWVLRVTGEAIEQMPTDLSLFWYVGVPGDVTAQYDPSSGIINGRNFQTCVVPSNTTNYASYWDDKSCQSKIYNATYFAVFQAPQHFNPKTNILQELRNPTSTLPPHLFDASSLYRAETVLVGNQIVQQLFLTTPFQVDFHLRLHESKYAASHDSLCQPSWEEVTTASNEARHRFQRRFKNIFMGGRQTEVSSIHRRMSSLEWTREQIRMAQYALGNMLSSISYMHGTSQIYDSVTKGIRTGLGWTIVPDRPDHAQGYLWDDGFHQQLMHLWDMDWAEEILGSWYGMADEQGWIPRQMILGDEARWSARPSSWPQVPGSANPPSHHWVLRSFLRYFREGEGEKFKSFLRSIWDPLERNIEWYLRTQASEIPGFFRWEGRTKEFCLPSGMDDYPRAPILTRMEAHLDLHCWMIVSCRAISKIASILGWHQKSVLYEERTVDLTNRMLNSFWDEKNGVFDDFYLDENKNKIFVGHLGYLNFFPIFLDVLPTNSSMFPHVLLRLLDRDNGLWTKYGLRSLSDKDPYFMKGDSYWTGPLWLNVNYLAVATLFRYSNLEEFPIHATVLEGYTELRQGLIQLVVDQFTETGFIWDVYDAKTGKGLDNHPFTGWSALIVNIMAELY